MAEQEGLMGYKMITEFTGAPEELDGLIDWMAASVAVLKHYKDGQYATKGAIMQREFTIQLRVDFADQGKLEPLKETLVQAAVHCLATARLISDNPKATQIVVFSEDFFHGHQAIALHTDTIQQGLDAIGETSGRETISSELFAAAVSGNGS
jgi:hypothetical protein